MINPLGGTELALLELQSRMTDIQKERINIVTSTCRDDFIDPNKVNILWQQLSYDQENVLNIKNKNFTEKLDAIVFVSHWQYEYFKKIFDVPSHKSIVIHNATNSFQTFSKSKKGKLKLIYTSMPYRGLYILLKTIQNLQRDDIELDIYSSTIIYGKDFDLENRRKFEDLFEYAKKLPNVFYKGYGTNNEIREAVSNAHIMAYPCIFEETSCMSAIEALSAGCLMVSTDLGALKETCSTWANLLTYDSNENNLIRRYTKFLENSIENYWNDETQDKLKDQFSYYNKYYSWEYRIKQWQKLFDKVIKIKYDE
jgi:UDP-glucose:(glucosyl)LPS alpha-1,2-glucosyltransferase